ncbi:MAG: LacI family transcriptional regulator [Opitutaceae bacterium]|jgi:LacI family transcriptional regulator|nr:LacI family transcriptional regulator [Opitutaceae bacterium]
MPPYRKVTQKDIARKLGVSIALVSRVLSGTAGKIGIAAETIEAVRAEARNSLYVPQAGALAMKGKKTRTLGIVVLDFHDPFFAEIIAALQSGARSLDYSLLLVGFINRVPDMADLAPLRKHAVDGIIIAGSHGDASWLAAFEGLPVARIGHGGRAAFSVCVDEADAAARVAAHLAGLGRKNFLHAGRATPVHAHRWKRAEAAARRAGCAITRSLAATTDDFEAGLAAAGDVVRANADAAVCASDMVAMGVVKGLSRLGRRVPEDCAVAGFDDIPAAGRYIPSLTSFRQPADAFAKRALGFFASGAKDGGRVSLRGTLVARESTLGGGGEVLP